MLYMYLALTYTHTCSLCIRKLPHGAHAFPKGHLGSWSGPPQRWKAGVCSSDSIHILSDMFIHTNIQYAQWTCLAIAPPHQNLWFMWNGILLTDWYCPWRCEHCAWPAELNETWSCSTDTDSPVFNDFPPCLWGAHKFPQVVVCDDDPARLLGQVEQKPAKGWKSVCGVSYR